MLEFIKDQLKNNKRIPWFYLEYGAIAYKQMYEDPEDYIELQRLGKSKLVTPNDEDMKQYDKLTEKIHHPDDSMQVRVISQMEDFNPKASTCDPIACLFNTPIVKI